MRVCLFEDRGARDLEPLAATRPVFDLLCGASSLADKVRRAFWRAECGLLVRPELADVVRQERPGIPVNDVDWLRAGPVLLVNGRWLPPGCAAPPERPCVGLCGEEVAFAAVAPEDLPPDLADGLDDGLDRLRAMLPAVAAGGTVVRYVWELVDRNADQLRQEFARRSPPRLGPWLRYGWRPEGTTLVGPAERLLIDPSARVDPMVVFDTTEGPITVEHGAVIQAFSRLEGPCHIGAGTHLLGARLRGGVTLGPQCRVGGEVECSIVQGYANKYHDGFLGHSYVGAWVNIGAGCQASDLRCDYGEVRVVVRGELVATGRAKVGCYLGDHTKLGLACLLNTGTHAGPFSLLLPCGRLLPKYVPAFAATALDGLTARDDPSELLETAATVMRRRGVELTPAHAALYRGLHAATAAERARALQGAAVRRLRRSA